LEWGGGEVAGGGVDKGGVWMREELQEL